MFCQGAVWKEEGDCILLWYSDIPNLCGDKYFDNGYDDGAMSVSVVAKRTLYTSAMV